MSRATKVTVIILFVLVLLSLGLNGFLLWRLRSFEQQAQTVARKYGPIIKESLNQTISDLETFQNSTVEFEVQVNEDIPIKAGIPFNETFEIPIQVTVPISQEVSTTILVDPLQSGFEIPVDVTVPINIEVPIDVTVPVALDRTVPIETTVPLDLSVPVSIAMSDTDLAVYVERLRTGLISLNTFLDQLLSEVK